MLTDLQTRKLDLAFAHLDLNGNGQIERDEVLALASRLLHVFREAPNSACGNNVLGSYDQLWDEIATRADIDADGLLSPEEFRTGMPGRTDAAMLRPAVQALVDLCDTDGDGYLGMAEFTTMHRAFGTTPPDVRTAFAKIDRNGDGLLSVDELVDAAFDFYTTPDPDAVGNWLFGHL